MTTNRFEALSRIVLNNWHYINHRVLSFNEGINFFTGHSGSGKSTVIDAMQIVLYANTDGRGFFNKAAADDSDRNLIEYLRGMVNIGDNNEFSYLRNSNFSSTIVLELQRTDTRKCQCVGVVFNVETATNEITRLFFWHEGPLWENDYRTGKRAMTTDEVKDYLQEHYTKEEYYCGSHNERFRKQLYDIYLGGLDSEKFPLLFKRAIPFRMNIKLEDFVKEYICMEEDIHIEDMQESVMQYGRMQKKISDTREEISFLSELKNQHQVYRDKCKEQEKQGYFCKSLEIKKQKEELQALIDKIKLDEEEQRKKAEIAKTLDGDIEKLKEKSDDLLRQISESGYDNLKATLTEMNELVQQLSISKSYYRNTSNALNQWVDQDVTYNSTICAIEEFEKGTITQGELEKLQRDLKELREEVSVQHLEAKSTLRELKKEERQAQEDLERLKKGEKAYPKEVEQAREHLLCRLSQEAGKAVQVEVLADLLEIRDERFRNAVEGYLGGNKLSLIVEPRYAQMAMEIYKELDPKQYYRVAVLDTEKVEREDHEVLKNSLAEEVIASRSYVNAYINFQLGKVIKCETVEELRKCRIGVTPDCVLYHGYRIQHMNPDSYTKMAYIGKNSVRQRIKLLKEQLEKIEKQKLPQEEIIRQCDYVLNLETLSNPAHVYLGWLKDIAALKVKEREKEKLQRKLEALKTQSVDQWKEERGALLEFCDKKKNELNELEKQSWSLGEYIKQNREKVLNDQELLMQSEDILKRMVAGQEEFYDVCEEAFVKFIEKQGNLRFSRLLELCVGRREEAGQAADEAKNSLVDLRTEYLRKYINRSGFSPTEEDNKKYDELMERLSCDNLEEYQKIAAEQAKAAVVHFKDDFIFKIRSAIREAVSRKDELNKVINKLDFGKDKYQFVIDRNKGIYGTYYDMFMDESLEVNPAHLSNNTDSQLNMFSMEHENRYGEQMNELINVFIPPENATREQMEEAKRNMDKFADYRTYLFFDMQQIIRDNGSVMKIGLGKMIRKNSGGEGQNPLYVALLASFAQAYRINLTPKLQRKPTIRLVVLDEAFSKMDSEKVASCIELIRGLGFQAIISATNDKIQNYLENVDKTFVFANPGKKSISIQEFERTEFGELSDSVEEE